MAGTSITKMGTALGSVKPPDDARLPALPPTMAGRRGLGDDPMGPLPASWTRKGVSGCGGTYDTLVAPREGILAFAAGDVVWMIEQGNFGENHVVRYRVRVGR